MAGLPTPRHLTLYATTNIQNLTATLVGPVLAAVLYAIAGGSIVAAAARRAAA